MKRGEVWLLNLDPTIGAEISKTRPVVIISNDRTGILPIKIVVPITEWKDKFQYAPWLVKIEKDVNNKLDKTSCADTLQIRSVSFKRFVCKIGEVDNLVMRQISLALNIVIND